MEEYDDLGTYNGDTEHDMWVDFDHYESIRISDVFEEANLHVFIDFLNEWN